MSLKIRGKYNYLKHRGTYHFTGLGVQDRFLAVRVNGNNHRMLNKESLDLDAWKQILFEFDVAFKKYFEVLIYCIMPEDYLDQNYAILAPAEYERKMQAYLETRGPTI